MNILTDSLAKEITVDSAIFPINWDFRTSIKFELLMQNDKINEADKVIEALSLYFDENTLLKINKDNINEVIEGILWFYQAKNNIEKITEENKEYNAISSESERFYDFEEDAIYIYSAFKSNYNIDLQEEKLHWWKFKALFQSLTDCKFIEIVGYRAVNLHDISDENQKAFYSKMKDIYALPERRAEKNKIKMINELLMQGKNPSELLKKE